jgi:hypothetical protein
MDLYWKGAGERLRESLVRTLIVCKSSFWDICLIGKKAEGKRQKEVVEEDADADAVFACADTTVAD